MRLLRLKIVNFGAFAGEHRLELERLGLVSVLGRNLVDVGADANGVGKSTILDALMWGLFGETSVRKDTATTDAGLKGDDVVNEVVGKDCFVGVDVEGDDGLVYRIERWRKAKVTEKRGNGVWLLRYEGDGAVTERGDSWSTVADLDAGEVQHRIDAVLGLDRDLFAATVVRSQEDANNFAQASPKGRADILTTIEGVSKLDVWLETFRTKARGVEHAVLLKEGEGTAKRQAVALLREEDDRVRADAARWEAERLNRVQEARARFTAAEQHAAGLAVQTAGRQQLEEQQRALQAELAACVVAPEPAEMTAWRVREKELVALVTAAETRLTDAKARLARARAPKSDTCSACGQRLPTKQHAEQHVAGLEAEVAALQAAVAPDGAHPKALAEARAFVAKGIAGYDAYRTAVMQEQGRLRAELGRVGGQLQAFATNDRAVAVARQTVEHLRAAAEAEERATNPHNVTARAERIGQLEAEAAGIDADAAKLKTELGLVEWWIRAIPVMKAWIFDAAVDDLTREANRWLSILTGGLCWVQIDTTATTKGGELRDKVVIRCFRWNADGSQTEREFRRWSGGEKRRFQLALDWAIAARLARRSQTRCSFLALDEVDRNLDAAGRAGLLAALDHLRREKETVIVVSHDSEFRARPDVRWTVVKDKDGSKIEVQRGEEDQGIGLGTGGRLAQAGGDVRPKRRARAR